MQLFERLPSVAKFYGQPIEQLRMGWHRASMPEIARRIHQTSVEMVTPDSIDNGSPGQGIAGIGNPLGQRLAPASLVIRVRQTEFMRRHSDSRESAGPGDFA